jgi:hypothetical protein
LAGAGYHHRQLPRESNVLSQKEVILQGEKLFLKSWEGAGKVGIQHSADKLSLSNSLNRTKVKSTKWKGQTGI